MDAAVAKPLANTKRLIQITDCHLGPLTSETLLGLNTDQSLHDVLALIQQKEPEFESMVCTGDIASAGHDACYHRFISIVRQYFSHPLGWLPGNHDSSLIMANLKAADLPSARTMEVGNWLILLLDSVVPGHVYGEFPQAELDYLAEALANNRNRHIIVMFHHQPVRVGSIWIDQYIVRNADAFWALVDGQPQVKAVVWGHVHQDFRGQRKGVELVATPSTCIQFKPLCDDFTVDTQMPGYRWFDLHEDGSLTTGVERVTGKDYQIDYKSAGY